MRIKKISPTTPANGNIENEYGTSQTNAYSEAYVNSKLAEKLDATGGTISGGLTVSGDITNKSLDLYNDTSGADWKAFLKNKIDYCVANMDTTKPVTSMFINGGWAGVTFGNGIFTKINNIYTLTWFAEKGTYFCIKDGTNYQYKVLGNNNCHNYEEVIGTWIDGKPLYRKVISGTLNQTETGTITNTDIATGIINCENLFIKNAYFINSNRYIPIPYFTNSGNSVRMIPVAGGQSITIMNDYGGYGGSTVIIIVEYTKTTD